MPPLQPKKEFSLLTDGYKASGPFHQGAYAELIYEVHHRGLSGILCITHGNRNRSLYFIGGLPVLYKTTLPEEQLEKTLVFGNMISKSKLNKVLSQLDPNGSLEDALLKSRLIRRAQLDQHLTSRLQNGIGAPLHWQNGEWSFQVFPELDTVSIDLELLPPISTLQSLWQGVKQHISMDAVMELVRQSNMGMENGHKVWMTSEDLNNHLAGFKFEAPFNQLKGVLKDGITPDEVMAAVPDNSGNLVKLLWLLENIGLLKVEGQPSKSLVAENLTLAIEGRANQQEDASETPQQDLNAESARARRRRAKAATRLAGRVQRPRKRPEKNLSPVEALEKDHQTRLQTNYYEFLGLRPSDSKEEIERTCKRLAQRWRSAANSQHLEERSRQQAKELLGGIRQVWEVFRDDAARAGYNQKLDLGKAPVVRTVASTELSQILGEIPGAASFETASNEAGEGNWLEQGVAFIEQGNFQGAWQALERARQDNPSCPDTLAALGWAAYHVKHQARLEEDPEDFLRLALTFEPDHGAALEYYARISLKRGELERAEPLLERLLKQRPTATWAQRELSQIRAVQSRDKGRRFWRKGDDR